ncbi:hypothetical protein ACIBKX_29970, partial [Streptomyces sp. NPDC050658]
AEGGSGSTGVPAVEGRSGLTGDPAAEGGCGLTGDPAAEGDSVGDPAAHALRTALATPLMVGLARVAYSDTGADPRELLDPERFSDHRAIELHLLDGFIPAVYGIGLDDRDARGPWDAAQAHVRLAFLARHLKRAETQEIAWWRLDLAAPRLLLFLASLLPLGVLLGTLLWSGLGYDGTSAWWGGPIWLTFAALTVVGAVLDAFVTDRADLAGPRRVTFPAGWRPWRPLSSLSAPADTVNAAGPRQLLRADRFALLTGRTWRMESGDDITVLETALIGTAPWAVLGWWDTGRWSETGVLLPCLIVAGCLGAVFLYRVVISAWGRYTVARAWFAVRGVPGRRLNAFLEDAHQRGVLRQSGGVYLFRHAELLDRLATGTPTERTTGTPTERTPPERRSGQEAVAWMQLAHLLVASTLVVWGLSAMGDLKGRPGPYTGRLPDACKLVSEPGYAFDEGSDKPLVPSSATSRGTTGKCAWTSELPGPQSTVRLTWTVARPDGRRDAEQVAADVLDGYQGDRFHKVVPVPERVGEQARAVVLDTRGEYTQDVTVHARAANVYISLRYSEEFADRDRQLSAAAILAQQFLNNAHLSPPPTRSLASLPGLRLPGDSVYARHRDIPARSVLGPVWGSRETSELQSLEGVPFVFQSPRMTCGQESGDRHWSCGADMKDEKGRPVEGFMQLDVDRCPDAGCSAKAWSGLDRGFPWIDEDRDGWKWHDKSTAYGETRFTQSEKTIWPGVKKIYLLGMRHAFTIGTGEEARRYALAFQMAVDARHADLAQKTLNDMVTQTR